MKRELYNSLDASEPRFLPWWRMLCATNGHDTALVLCDQLEEWGYPEQAAVIRKDESPTNTAKSVFDISGVARDLRGEWYPRPNGERYRGGWPYQSEPV